MLVLSRQRDETVEIISEGQTICTVQVVDIRGDKVRLGFTADRDLQIHRQEVVDSMRRHGEIEQKKRSGRSWKVS